MFHFYFYGEPPPTRKQWEAALDHFAELLSRDIGLNEIASIMEVSRGTVCVFLKWLSDEFGWQSA